MKIMLKDKCRGGWLSQVKRIVEPGEVLDVDEKLGAELISTGEFVSASVHEGVTLNAGRDVKERRG